MGKNKHSKAMSFSNILGEAEIHYNSQNMGKVDFHGTEKAWENTNISNLILLLLLILYNMGEIKSITFQLVLMCTS